MSLEQEMKLAVNGETKLNLADLELSLIHI